MKSEIRCDRCGGICPNGTKHSGRNKHHFCGMDCYLAFRTKKMAVRCEWCGKEFQKKRSDVARTKHNFCSHECSVSFTRWSGLSNRSAKSDGKQIHRIIAEDMLGRELRTDEEVHHIDFNHHNNRSENLMILSKSEHSRIHAAKKERDEHGRFITKNSNV